MPKTSVCSLTTTLCRRSAWGGLRKASHSECPRGGLRGLGIGGGTRGGGVGGWGWRVAGEHLVFNRYLNIGLAKNMFFSVEYKAQLHVHQ